MLLNSSIKKHKALTYWTISIEEIPAITSVRQKKKKLKKWQDDIKGGLEIRQMTNAWKLRG